MNETVLSEAILRGEVRAAARLMRDIDDEIPSAREELKVLFPHTGRAHIVGITGSPGTGKSTLVDHIIQSYRQRSKTVGVVAVDPTSPFTGGAILGDRVRMQRHSTDDGVFIRSLATRGHLGGLSRSTHDIVDVMDAMGKDVVLVETVGVGQDEVEIVRLAHTNVVVLIPGMGDEIQAIKAGILEVGDIFVVNKADREGADKSVREIEIMLEMNAYGPEDWRPVVLKTEAINHRGVEELVDQIQRHREFLGDRLWKQRQQRRTQGKFMEILRDLLYQEALGRLEKNGLWNQLLEELAQRKLDPYTAAEMAMAELLRPV
ncbi:MAG: methylmalonyl Co-A mutase-associated GTPase MeaB [Thermodesulfobacteriota bacterium]